MTLVEELATRAVELAREGGDEAVAIARLLAVAGGDQEALRRAEERVAAGQVGSEARRRAAELCARARLAGAWGWRRQGFTPQ